MEEDLIEIVDSSGEDKKIQTDVRHPARSTPKDQTPAASDTSPNKRSNESIYSSSLDDWVARKKPKTLTEYFSASRSGSASSLQSLDASAEMKKSLNDQSSDAVLASMTSSLKSSSSFSSKEKFAIQIEDDDFKSPSSRSISPVKIKSQSS